MADTVTSQEPPKMDRKTSGVKSTKGAAEKNIKSKASDTKSEAPNPSDGGQHDFEDQTDSGVDGLTTSNDEDEKDEKDDDDASDVVPAGSVNSKGEVVSEAGKVVGHVSGENASQLEGSFVDLEGDVLDQEGNVIGHADVDEETVKELAPKPTSETGEEAKSAVGDKEVPDVEGSEKPDLDEAEKPDVSDVAGSEKPSAPDVEGSEKPDVEGAEKPEVPDAEGTEKPEVPEADKSSAEGTVKPDVPDAEGSEKPELAEGEKPEGSAPDVDKSAAEGVENPELTGPFGVQDNGEITNATGAVIGKLAEGEPQDLVGTSIKEIDGEGNLIATNGSIIGKAELKSEVLDKADQSEAAKPELVGPFSLQSNGDIHNTEGQVVAKLPETPEGEEGPDLKSLKAKSIKEIDEEGNLKDESGSVLAKAELIPELLPESGSQADSKLDDAEVPEGDDAEAEVPDLSILKGMKVNKTGKVVDEEGNPYGVLIEGDAKKLYGKKVDGEGKIWDDSGNVIGKVELLPENERAAEPSAPFEDFPDSVLDAKGNVIFEGKIVGKLIEGDAKKLEGKKVDQDGDVLDSNGNTLGKAERWQEPDEEAPAEEEPEDLSILEGKKVNKVGNVVDDAGKLFGRVNSGVLSKLVGKKTDKEGKIWSESGKVIGTAELIPAEDREEAPSGPFEDFPDAVVNNKGDVIFEEQVIGKLIEGDAKKLAGKKVDADGEILDKVGNVLGKAERWDEPDAPEAEKVDNSALAGKRVNKAGNVVDSTGQIYGKLVEGDAKKLAGRMCNKEGNVMSESGDVIGRAELVPESERSGEKEGPFAGFNSPTVTKDGKVADSTGAIIGRLIEGEAAKLYGKAVDSDGDVVDANGNTLGKAERWEEEVKEKKANPVAGRKINRDGNVLDDDGDVIAKLVDGEIGKCIGKEIDDDGDIVNSKGTTLGHVSLLEDIPEPEAEPEPEPEVQEDPEEVKKREKIEADNELAKKMAGAIQQSLDKIKPILSMITHEIDVAESKPKEELDEQKLVDTVKPLIEQGGQILSETNGTIRGLDPDGRISSNAKAKSATREATPEEHHLADVLKELTENVHTTIEQAKKKIAGMPHAKKQLNPLWGLLAEPLGQILAAVGLLLAGVLGLVGKLLSGLGLGGLLDNLLGGLGVKGILKGLGLGMVTDSLTGKK